MRRQQIAAILIGLLAAGCAAPPTGSSGPTARSPGQRSASREPESAGNDSPPPAVPIVGDVQAVAIDDGAIWTGVTVSRDGRVFVCYPRWDDDVEFTVAELRQGRAVAYPDAGLNRYDPNNLAHSLVSVQSVVVGPDGLLWILDTGAYHHGPTLPGAAKLVAVDLGSNRIVKTIFFPPDVALPASYLNDVRFNPRHGKAGMAYITDSGDQGPDGIIVVDLDSQKSWRKLSGEASVRAQKGFTANVEGAPFLLRPAPGVARPVTVGADGIAISDDGETLFYCPMSGQHLFGVSTRALDDPDLSDAATNASVVDYGDRGYASDGLGSDAAGHLYLTDYEHDAVHRWTFGPAGPSDIKDEIIAQGPRLVWPDTLSVAADGYLYFTANQLCRSKQYHEGRDLRRKPYLLLRTRIASPAARPG